MTPLTKTVAPFPLPLAGANGDRCVSPLPATDPCTEPIVLISVTATLNEQLADCGAASLLAAVTCTV